MGVAVSSFGTLTDGRSTIELHAEAELCESIDYKEGAEAAIEIVYDPSKQYVPEKNIRHYTIH